MIKAETKGERDNRLVAQAVRELENAQLNTRQHTQLELIVSDKKQPDVCWRYWPVMGAYITAEAEKAGQLKQCMLILSTKHLIDIIKGRYDTCRTK